MISLPKDKLEQLLVQEGILDAKEFDAMYTEAERKKQHVVDIAISRGLLTEDYFYSLLSKFLGVPRARLASATIDESLLRMLPQDIARQRRAVIFGRQPDGAYDVAMEDPTDLETVDFLTLRLKAPVVPHLATDGDLQQGFVLYEKRRTLNFEEMLKKSIDASLAARAKGTASKESADVPVVELVDTLLSYAVSLRASDIHFEAIEDALLVRFRVDGILREIIRIPKDIHSALVARLKVLSGLRVDEHMRPQDGRFRYMVMHDRVDVRVSIIPTFYGEKSVLRLLAAAQKPVSFSDLGMLEDHIALIETAMKRSYGMVLVCGPTGVGKTTTLYSFVNTLNHPEVNIVTVEDPIEYDMRYVNQVQVNPSAGITFATGLRSILRQDPNIIMVGEIRDEETAAISVQAALTGHLLLSSLHTNDSPTAIPRLVDMHVPPFLIAAVLAAVSSQRLVRRIHTACVESYEPDPSVVASITKHLTTLGDPIEGVFAPMTFYRGRGCSECGETGYLGQMGVFEIFLMTEAIRKHIVASQFDLDALRRAARTAGMLSMFEDGLRKVARGMTTIEEVFRVTWE